MIVPFCMIGKHAVEEGVSVRLVRASTTIPVAPPGGFPISRGPKPYRKVSWYPEEASPASIIVCAEHDTDEWAAAPTARRR